MNKISKIILVLAVCCFAVFTVYVSLSRQDYRILGAAAAIPFALYFMNHTKVLLALIFVFMYTALVLPGFPRDAQIFHVLAIYYILLWVAGSAIHAHGHSVWECFPKIPIILFIINVAIVILVRGAGFRALGDTRWGGYRYVHILLPLVFLLSIRFVKLSTRQWDLTYKWMLVFSFLPLLTEILFLASGGRVYFMYYLVQFRSFTLSTFQATETEVGIVRFVGAKNAGVYIIIGALTLVRFKEWRKYLSGALIFLGIALIGYSGHRASIIEIIVFLWIYGLFYLKISRFNYLILSVIGGVLFLIVIYAFAGFLPLPFQRAMSFLPGIQISSEAMRSAVGTTEWRLDVWTEALKELKMNLDYLLIGRGYTYSGAEMEILQSISPWEYNYWWAVISVAYHSGPLSLLIGLGVTGLILGFFLFGIHIHRGLKFSCGLWMEPRLKIYFDILFYYNIAMIFTYIVIYGDTYSNFPQIFWRAAMLEGMAFTNQSALANAKKIKDEASEYATD